jgi:predicted site-specific integrase-resolvase
MSEFVSSFEAAQIIGCAPDTIRWLAREGRIPVAIETKAGRLFRRDDVERLARERREREAAAATA